MKNNEILIIDEDSSVKQDPQDNHLYSIEETAVAKSDYTCPVCACTVCDDEEQHVCETCGTPHHKDCYEYAEGCAIFGCKKGVIRYQSNGQQISEVTMPINMGIMSVWSVFFRIHWLSFLVTTVGLITALIFGSMYTALAAAVMAISSNGLILLALTWILAFIPAMAVPLGAMSYMMLLPLAIIMRIHFRSINLALPSGSSSIAKSIADKVDMPKTAIYVKKLSYLLRKLTEVMLVFFTIATILTGILSAFGLMSGWLPMAIGPLIAMLFTRFIMLPLFDAAIESRITILVTFQNRLIASAKQAKDIHS